MLMYLQALFENELKDRQYCDKIMNTTVDKWYENSLQTDILETILRKKFRGLLDIISMQSLGELLHFYLSTLQCCQEIAITFMGCVMFTKTVKTFPSKD